MWPWTNHFKLSSVARKTQDEKQSTGKWMEMIPIHVHSVQVSYVKGFIVWYIKYPLKHVWHLFDAPLWSTLHITYQRHAYQVQNISWHQGTTFFTCNSYAGHDICRQDMEYIIVWIRTMCSMHQLGKYGWFDICNKRWNNILINIGNCLI